MRQTFTLNVTELLDLVVMGLVAAGRLPDGPCKASFTITLGSADLNDLRIELTTVTENRPTKALVQQTPK